MNAKMIRDTYLGVFTPRSLLIHIGLCFAGFWGLVFAAWLTFPPENHYSIMTDTFSFLGSYERDNNPDTWYILTLAMLWWGCSLPPLIFYMHRHYSKVSKFAVAGTGFMLLGTIGAMLIGVFPDVRTALTGDVRITDVHEKLTLIAFGGYALGLTIYLGLTIHDRFRLVRGGGANSLVWRRLVGPYAVLLVVSSIAAYFQIAWEFVYPAWKSQDPTIGSHWRAALNTIYSFPLWENILIYMLNIVLIWLLLALKSSNHVTDHDAKV